MGGVLTGSTSPGAAVDLNGAHFGDGGCDLLAPDLPEGARHFCVVKGWLNSTSRVESGSGDVAVNLAEMGEYWPAVPV